MNFKQIDIAKVRANIKYLMKTNKTKKKDLGEHLIGPDNTEVGKIKAVDRMLDSSYDLKVESINKVAEFYDANVIEMMFSTYE